MTGQFLSVDPAFDLTRSAYSYAEDDPINGSDPLGLCWSGFGAVCGAIHTVAHVADNAKTEVSAHWRGEVQILGVAAGAAAAVTGVGALAEGSVALGLLSSSLGAAAGLADIPACIGTGGRHDGLACAGAAVGIVSGGLGGFGALAGLAVNEGFVAENSLFSIYGGLAGALGFAAGVGGTGFDLLNETAAGALGCPVAGRP